MKKNARIARLLAETTRNCRGERGGEPSEASRDYWFLRSWKRRIVSWSSDTDDHKPLTVSLRYCWFTIPPHPIDASGVPGDCHPPAPIALCAPGLVWPQQAGWPVGVASTAETMNHRDIQLDGDSEDIRQGGLMLLAGAGRWRLPFRHHGLLVTGGHTVWRQTSMRWQPIPRLSSALPTTTLRAL
jgi:hypothetical protein